MSVAQFREFIELYGAMIGVRGPIAVIVILIVGCVLLRQLPWERERPMRLGFLLVAPIVVTISFAVALLSGFGTFLFIMFGIFDDTIGMPWLMFFPALAIGPGVGMALGAGVAFVSGRVLRFV